MTDSRFRYGAWEWPETLAPLMQWAEGRQIDVYALKSDRQAFFLIKEVSKQKTKIPKRGASCIPDLVKLQRTLCPTGYVKINREETHRVHGLGTFGPASSVKKISVSEYLNSTSIPLPHLTNRETR